MAETAGWLRAHIRDIPDYPRPGVVFKDITTLLAQPDAFAAAVDGIAAPYQDAGVTQVLGVEARGFILAAPVAYRFGAAFVPVRKAGKLPWEIEKTEYELEYGTDLLEIHRDGLHPGDRVLIVDDVLATGGTASAAATLSERLGAEVVGFGFLIELAFLGGRSRLGDHRVETLVSYDS